MGWEAVFAGIGQGTNQMLAQQQQLQKQQEEDDYRAANLAIQQGDWNKAGSILGKYDEYKGVDWNTYHGRAQDKIAQEKKDRDFGNKSRELDAESTIAGLVATGKLSAEDGTKRLASMGVQGYSDTPKIVNLPMMGPMPMTTRETPMQGPLLQNTSGQMPQRPMIKTPELMPRPTMQQSVPSVAPFLKNIEGQYAKSREAAAAEQAADIAYKKSETEKNSATAKYYTANAGAVPAKLANEQARIAKIGTGGKGGGRGRQSDPDLDAKTEAAIRKQAATQATKMSTIKGVFDPNAYQKNYSLVYASLKRGGGAPAVDSPVLQALKAAGIKTGSVPVR